MSKITSIILSLLLTFALFGCASAGGASAGASADEAAAAAEAAMAAMDAAARGEPLSRPAAVEPSGGGSSAAAPATTAPAGAQPAQGNRGRPAWVDTPDLVYSKQRYVAAVGFGPERNQAERNALANLTAVFGQSIQAEMKSVADYSEAVKNGAIQVSENVSVRQAITISAEMDSLLGAEIADVWYDGSSVYYAAAVMEREKTAELYADLIRTNSRIITDLTTMNGAEKNSLNGYSRYQLAATIADTNRLYANVLTYVGNTTDINPGAMKKGDDYRLEAAEIIRNIPIEVTVSGDRSDRIKNAFNRALGSAGFRTGGANPRYRLAVTLALSPTDLPGQPYKYIRFTVDANLTDTASGNSVLFPFNVSDREGHLNLPEAENRALSVAEKRIGNDYPPALLGYLGELLPRR
jgi:hypothetical protein